MPRPRARSLFELGGQWIAEEPGRAGLYRFWNDAGTGRTRRASLGTADLEAAKTSLAEIIVKGAAKTADSHLSIVLEKYFTEKTDYQTAGDSARNAGRLMLENFGSMAKASVLGDDDQVKKFVRWSLLDLNHAVSTVSRNLGVGAAALAHSKISIDVTYNEGAILAKWPEFDPKPARVIFEPSDAELARLLAASMPESLRRWLLNSMATVGRPEAVLDLTPAARVRDRGLIDLNPKDRRQNKKYRPAVRELRQQTRWLDQWDKEDAAAREKGKILSANYCRYASVDSIDTALDRACAKPEVNLPFMSAYSIRHRAASVMRASKAPMVPEEQVNYQMGHRRPTNRTSRGYGQYGQEYLTEAARALETWITKVAKLAGLNSHGIPTASRVRKVKAA